MDLFPPVVANAMRGRMLDPTSRNLGLECLKLMGERLRLARGQDPNGDVDPSYAMPFGANERATLWQAARWINDGIDSRASSKLQEALAALHGVARSGRLPIDVAVVPAVEILAEHSDGDIRSLLRVAFRSGPGQPSISDAGREAPVAAGDLTCASSSPRQDC